MLAKIIEKRYPKSLASEWDSVGLVIGKQKNIINKILLTVDITTKVIDEAIKKSCDLIISHHPFILEPEEIEDIKNYKNKLKQKIEKENISIYVAHTNADIASEGVNDSLVKKFNLKNAKSFGIDNLGRMGVIEEPVNLSQLVDKIIKVIPVNKNAIQISGDKNKIVKTVAVCGGSGSSLLEQVRKLGVDVFITADLKHHQVLDNLELNGPSLISISHWASERVWLDDFQQILKKDLHKENFDLDIIISNETTDPWTFSKGFD